MLFIDPITISDGTTDGKRTSTNAVDEVIAAYNPATSYAIAAQVKYLHGIFESRTAANIGHTPTISTTGTADTYWRYLGPLNSWAMFDTSVETQTENENSITGSLTLGRPANAIAFLNCDAQSVTVTVTDPVEGVVYSKTVSLQIPAGPGWYAWLTTRINRKRDVLFLDLPMYGSAVISYVITYTGATAKCGVLSVGLLDSVGTADYSTEFGIVDYSKIKEDEFGNRYVMLRSYAKTMSVPITIDKDDVDTVARKFADYRQVNLVWIASENYEATILFGPYKSFKVVITMWGMSRCNLELQGLI